MGARGQERDRGLERADQLAAEMDEKVVIQRGCSNYIPRYAEHFKWTSSQQMKALTSMSRVIISQASAGAIIFTLNQWKPLVLVSRLKRYGENHDDHQQQLARVLANQGRAIVVDDPSVAALHIAINQVTPQMKLNKESDKLLNALRGQLDIWSEVGKGSK